MASRAQRTVQKTDATAPAVKARMAAWDQVAPSELAFDFTPIRPEAKSANLDWGSKDKAGVKEAIIRWLEEQL